MTAEELRLELEEVIADELDLDVKRQGKRLIVQFGEQTFVILVTEHAA